MKNLSKWYHFILIFLTLFLGMETFAQQRSISGVVTDEGGSPLPGVNVIIKGTTEGMITDLNGKYTISANEGATLIFSFVGFLTQEFEVGTSSTIDVTLNEDVVGLDEVVVIGYGTVKKRDLTGSVSSLKPKDFNKGIVVAPEQLIQGKIAGVDIVQNSGQPGSPSTVRIRGASSISAGNDPLYVVDGVPLQFGTSNEFVASSSAVSNSSAFTSEGTNPLNVINPSDIESIEVLKDASAAAIYGSRGANGVIIITTKSRKEGTEHVSYDTYFSWSKIRKTLPVLNAADYIAYAESDSLPYPDEGADTDWQNEIFRTAFGQNHNLSFTGGTANSNYRASFGYNDQEGIIISNKLKKYTGRINANQSGLDGKLNIGLNMTYAKINEDNTPISSNINNEGGNILKDAIRWAPTLPVYNEDGTYYQIGELRINPVSWQDVDDERVTNLFLGNAQLSYDILPVLRLSVNMGYSDENVERFTNVPNTHPAGETEGGRASINKNRNYSSVLETNLNFHKDIDDIHSINALVGYSYQQFFNEYTFTSANQFVSSATKWNLMQSGTLQANTSYKTENLLVSYYGRINYKLLDRYLFTFTLRNDGSSRFGGNNKFGLFPSGAFAWNINEEDFFHVDLISNLKFRFGYGVTGNQEIPNDLFREQLSVAGSNIYVLGGQAIPSVLPSNYANPDLKWEETHQTNIGLDFGILADRLSMTIDYYTKKTADLLLEFSTAAPSVVTSQWANVGEVQNKGIELSLDAKVIKRQDFQWNALFVFSKNTNEVISLSNDQFSRDEIENAPTSGVISNGGTTQIIKPGLALGTFWGRKYTGLDENGMETYLDADNDGVSDRVEIGCAQPDFTYGIASSFYYKNVDLSISLRGVSGIDVYNNTIAEFSYKNSAPGTNVLESAISSQTSREQIPQFSSQWIEGASYLRLDNLSIGYSFNTTNISYLSRARIYVTGQNLFVISQYSGYDPEVRTNTNSNKSGPVASGIDYLAYPRPRVFMIGASVAF
jgi:TonB-dependent starch-binding outer membrane protein SusC